MPKHIAIVSGLFLFFGILGFVGSGFDEVDGVITGASNLEVQNHSFCTMEYGVKGICGTIVNNSNKNFSYAQVEINLFDKNGAVVGSTLDNINNLDAGQKWKFQAAIIGTNAASYAIKDITAY